MIAVTQAPFLATLVISFMRWNALYPDDIGFAGLKQLRHSAHRPRAALLGVDHRAAHRGCSAGQPAARAGNCAAAGPFLSGAGGVVRTMVIAPFLVVPVAAALVWKTRLLNPEYGLINGILTWLWRVLGLGSAPQPDWVSTLPPGQRWRPH